MKRIYIEKKNKRDKKICVLFSEKELLALVKTCEDVGENLSEYIRNSVFHRMDIII